MNSDDVTELVRRARSGEESAWNAIVEEYTNVVWAAVRRFRLTDAQAADAVQTTWLRLVEHLDAIKNPACIPAWLSTTARRTSLEVIRMSGREFAVDPHQDTRMQQLPGSTEDAPEFGFLRNEDIALVRTALATLDERDRVLLSMLTSSEHIGYREISARLDLPIGSIGPTRGRALGRLRTALAALGVTELVD